MLSKKVMAICLGLVVCGSISQAVEINGIDVQFVTITNAGNAADSSGYGAVGYNYNIGQYEITASQWATAIADDSRIGNGGSWSGSQATGSATWYEAARFANWLTTGDAYTGKYQFDGSGVLTNIMSRTEAMAAFGTAYALPTADEWYKAAYYNGSGYNTYANSSNSLPSVEGAANYGGSGGLYNSPWAVGTGDQELNGTFDMMGNVWEWTEGGDAALTTNSISFWGGSYLSGASTLDSGAPNTDFPDTIHPTIGLRIVAIPEPGTISLMSLSTVGLFLTRSLRRRRRLGSTLLPSRRMTRCDEFCVAHVDADSTDWEDQVDIVTILVDLTRRGCVNVVSSIKATYKEVNVAFWNRMVETHERKLARRAAFRATMRKKLLDGLDAFLARIIK